jgi:hypothetical protein
MRDSAMGTTRPFIPEIVLMYTIAKSVLRRPYRAMRRPYDWFRLRVLKGLPFWGQKSFTEKLAWDLFPQMVRVVSSGRARFRALDPDFAAQGLKRGLLPEESTRRLMEVLRVSTPKPMLQDDHVEGYAFHPALRLQERDLNRDMTFLFLGPEQLAVIEPVIASLRDPIAACFGSPWRVVNVRSWITHARSEERGPNAWHTDGLPFPVWKIMIYLTGVGPQIGTTEIRLADGSLLPLEGPPGTWMLFKPSELEHRGVPPKGGGDRYLLELIAAPSFRNDQRTLCAGLNAHYPSMPWFRPSHRQLARAGVLDP